jgi:hypothetical protein
MNINPTSPHGAGRSGEAGADRVRDANARPEAAADQHQPETEAAAAAAAQVQVSSDAKALASQSGTRPSGGALAAERLKEIGTRIAQGYYDRPEVIDQVARHVLQDPAFGAQ